MDNSQLSTRWRWGAFLVPAVLGLHVPWLFQGLDLTDAGYHLYNQVHSFALPPDSRCRGHLPYFLCDLAGGAWLAMLPVPSLLWAKLGFLVLTGLNAFICYWLLSAFFASQRVFLMVLASTIFITASTFLLIDYYTFPALLLNLLLLLLFQIQRKPHESIGFRIFSFLLGCTTVTIVLARFPLVLVFFIPFMLYEYGKLAGKDLAKFWAVVPFASAGTVVATVFYAVLYHRFGILSAYLHKIYWELVGGDKSPGVYSPFEKLWIQLVECWDVVQMSAFAAIGLIVVSLLKNRWQRLPVNLLLVPTCSLWLIGMWERWPCRKVINLAIGMILMGALTWFLRHKKQNPRLAPLILASVFIMLITPIGSDNGLYKAVYGMWLAFPLVALALYQMRETCSGARLRSILSLGRPLWVVLLVVAVFLQYKNIYRDIPDRRQLTEPFRYPFLAWTYSSEHRVKAVDEALEQICHYVRPGDEVLMENSIPMLYYLTRTRSSLGDPWNMLKALEKLMAEVEQSLQENRYPRLFVLSRTNTRDFTWPVERLANPEDIPKIAYLKDRFVRQLGYQLVWENSLVEVYKPPWR